MGVEPEVGNLQAEMNESEDRPQEEGGGAIEKPADHGGAREAGGDRQESGHDHQCGEGSQDQIRRQARQG